jgi:hypothetical protein
MRAKKKKIVYKKFNFCSSDLNGGDFKDELVGGGKMLNPINHDGERE